MRVELTQFCHDFTAALRPLSKSLDDSIVALHDVEDPASQRDLLSAFVDVQHRLKILTDKAEQQHAYLLIFGPLKSGKSTLMNAISGAYVSEVSSLPAYPCLVYVHEGEPRNCSVTLFNGAKETFESEESLHERIEQAHVELAEQLRQADREQRPFNPAMDFPRAIRRIDYVVPAPNLRQSGTILVDTPGLYTKMRYNYEQLTRDFRHNAACAVFVVKTDNLFFDQVFDEFKDLLGVFSRIFLVVNIDSSKQDLAPRGDLRPALESREPRRIIQAFENFTVSAQLREAIDTRQLQIYLVDLLDAARRSLSGETLNGAEPIEAAEQQPNETDETGAQAEEAESAASGNGTTVSAGLASERTGDQSAAATTHPSASIGFESFLQDLTRYLNSSDYIIEFMADSLRQGENLVSEIRDEMASDDVQRFRAQTDQLKREADALSGHLQHIEALQKTDWKAALQEVSRELEKQRQGFTEGEVSDLLGRLEAHVANWFGSDESLETLINAHLRPEIAAANKKLHGRVDQLVRERFQQRDSGLKLDAQTIGHLHKLDLSLDALYRDFSGEPEISANETNGDGMPPIDLHEEELPVKRRFLDWITFRSPRAIRRRLLGTKKPSERKLSANTKEKRLGQAANGYLLMRVERYVHEDLQGRDRQVLQHTVEAYGDYFEKAVQARLTESRNELQSREKSLRARYQANLRVMDEFESLSSASGKTIEMTGSLRRRFVADREERPTSLETAPVEQDDPSVPPASAVLEEDSDPEVTRLEA